MWGQHPDDMGEMATPHTAHLEWHTNTGVPLGVSGCPQDGCDNQDEFGDDWTPEMKAEADAKRKLEREAFLASLPDDEAPF